MRSRAADRQYEKLITYNQTGTIGNIERLSLGMLEERYRREDGVERGLLDETTRMEMRSQVWILRNEAELMYERNRGK